MRPQCSVFIAASLDGFIARPDGRIDWLSLVERPGKDYGYKSFFDSVDTLVMRDQLARPAADAHPPLNGYIFSTAW